MNPTSAALPTEQPTHHAMLVVWGQFAQELGFLAQLAQVPIPQKTVQHPPAAKLATLFMGLLSGMEYLTDLTRAPAPLSPSLHDPAPGVGIRCALAVRLPVFTGGAAAGGARQMPGNALQMGVHTHQPVA